MCMLGTMKVPYIYNNSIIPYSTALINVNNGLLIYKNTYIQFNFESNGMGMRSVQLCRHQLHR